MNRQITGRYEPIESVQTGFRMETASSRMETARLNLIQTQVTRKEHSISVPKFQISLF